MRQPCDKAVRCPDPNRPLTNFSSEQPDQIVEFGRYYVGPDGPPFDPIHIDEDPVIGGCTTFATGLLRDDADLCAARHAAECTSQSTIPDPCVICRGDPNPNDGGFWQIDQNDVGSDPCCNPNAPSECCCDPDPSDPDPTPPPPSPPNPPAPQLYGNMPQTCTVRCPDGSPYSFSVRAGIFVGQSQEMADRMAYSEACRLAYVTMICIEDYNETICVGQSSERHISARVRQGSPHFTIVAGSLPQGLSLEDDGSITGIPVATGSSNFTVQVCNGVGQCATRSVNITVIGAYGTLPGGTVCSSYSGQISYYPPGATISVGGLPAGLSANDTGAITGKPLQGGDFSISVTVTHNGVDCENTIPLNVVNLGDAASVSDMVWTPFFIPGVGCSSSGGGSGSGGSAECHATPCKTPGDSYPASNAGVNSSIRNCSGAAYTIHLKIVASVGSGGNMALYYSWNGGHTNYYSGPGPSILNVDLVLNDGTASNIGFQCIAQGDATPVSMVGTITPNTPP